MPPTVENHSGAGVYPRRYYLYGLKVDSPWPLPCPMQTNTGIAALEFFVGSSNLFAEALEQAGTEPESAQWDYYGVLRDGAEYVRWNKLFEFVISADGRKIAGRPFAAASWEAFHTYLLGHVLSYGLLKLGFEPLHATVVVVDGRAVGFLGQGGYGKSSLAAAFLQAGHRLLTDDLLVVEEEGDRMLAYPGIPRIKLFPEIASILLGKQAAGTPMNPYTQKLVIPLAPSQAAQDAKHLMALYVLNPPTAKPRNRRVTIRKLPRRRAFLSLVSSTFNTKVINSKRLAQQFAMADNLSASIPIKSLSYPRELSRFREVVDTIRADLA